MHPFLSFLRLPAVVGLLWYFLPDAGFFVATTIGFATVWILLGILPLGGLLRMLWSVYYAEHTVPRGEFHAFGVAFTFFDDVGPAGWPFHAVCVIAGLLVHTVVMEGAEERTLYGPRVARTSRNPHGFSQEDIYELSLQGVRPWDEDAPRVLAALND